MKGIQLTQGKVALIDEEDFALVSPFSWDAFRNEDRGWYARKGAKPKEKDFMHRLICGLAQKDPRHGDHRNGDGLDNRRENLRVCTRAQNAQNRKTPAGRFKGVSLAKHHDRVGYNLPKPWKATISANKQHIFLGLFATAEEAARAYDCAALQHHGEFARLNFADSRYLATVEALLSA